MSSHAVAGPPVPSAACRYSRRTASRAITSASAIMTSAATQASASVMWWLNENRAMAGPAP